MLEPSARFCFTFCFFIHTLLKDRFNFITRSRRYGMLFACYGWFLAERMRADWVDHQRLYTEIFRIVDGKRREKDCDEDIMLSPSTSPSHGQRYLEIGIIDIFFFLSISVWEVALLALFSNLASFLLRLFSIQFLRPSSYPVSLPTLLPSALLLSKNCNLTIPIIPISHTKNLLFNWKYSPKPVPIALSSTFSEMECQGKKRLNNAKKN